MKYGSVIIADFHQGILEGVRSLLETMFSTTVMVASRDSLFEAVEKLNPSIVVLDLSIKPKAHLNIVVEFVNTFPETKLVVMSAYDDRCVVDQIMKSGASGFVLKRAVATELIPAVEQTLNGNTFVSSALS